MQARPQSTRRSAAVCYAGASLVAALLSSQPLGAETFTVQELGLGPLTGSALLDGGHTAGARHTWWVTATPIDVNRTKPPRRGPDAPGEHWLPYSVPGNLFDVPALRDSTATAFWIRKAFYLPADAPEQLSVRLGVVMDRDRAYLNGQLIGSTGIWDSPRPQGYDRIRIYDLPPSAVRRGGTNVLIAEVRPYFPKQAGAVRDHTSIGPTARMHADFHRENYVAALFLVCYLTVGCYFIFLFLRQRSERENLYFGLSVLMLVVYLLNRNQLKYETGLTLFTLKRIEYTMLFAVPIPFFFFIRRYFTLPDARWARFLDRVGFGATAVLLLSMAVIYSSDDVTFWSAYFSGFLNRMVWPILFGCLMVILGYRALKRDSDAILMLVGFLVVIAGVIVDSLSNMLIINVPRVGPYTFFAFVLCIAFVLANRFMRVHEELVSAKTRLERLSAELQESRNALYVRATGLAEKVSQRTLDLRVSYESLPLSEVALAGGRTLVYRSRAMATVVEQVEQAASTDLPVLILGESGTGKELIARLVHERSAARTDIFVALNCAALPETLLESELFGHRKGAFTGADRDFAGRFAKSNGGSLFLDEIGDMPVQLQSKLLRILQERSYNRLGDTEVHQWTGRLILATNADLKAKIAGREFRQDLFFRINTLLIELPPLRYRREDIIPLAVFQLASIRKRMKKPPVRLTLEAEELLLNYDWPGNVRELENVVQQAAVRTGGREVTRESFTGDILGTDTRPPTQSALPATPDARPLQEILSGIELQLIRSALEQANQNQTRAAELLHLPRKTFVNKLKKYGLG